MAKIDPNEKCPCGSNLLFGECHGPKVRLCVTPEITEKIFLKVIPEPDPDSRAVFDYRGEGTIIFRGFDTGLAFCCGKCHSHLAVGIQRGSIKNIVLKCKNCGVYNEVGFEGQVCHSDTGPAM